MMPSVQRTIRRAIPCTGIGLHSGQKVTVALKPAPADYGIRFQRTDLGGVEIPATVAHLGPQQVLQTTLVNGVAKVDTVEHLLSALRGLGIDNVAVELSHPEVPIMDGSAAPWVYLIQEAGVRELTVPRKVMRITRAVTVTQGDKSIGVYPSDGFKVSYAIQFDHPLLRSQKKSLEINETTFINEIAPARTFGFLKEVEMLRQRGLVLGGSLDNAVVLGETGVLNALRFEDEFVRHKMLDVIGDLMLVGHQIQGHVTVQRGGHALHAELATEILRQTDCWTLVEAAVPTGQRVAVHGTATA
jgi:UDP-3-O-[3-hydroxymyristoyl] N-acetylglucosamine deacetylase